MKKDLIIEIEFFYIKNASKNKTKDDIMQMIKADNDFLENKLQVLNKMIGEILRIIFIECFF